MEKIRTKEDEEPEILPQVSHSKWSSEQKREKEGKGKNYDKAETDRYDLVSFCFSSYRKSKMRMKYRGLD